jgi:hypothetical protein
LQRTGKDSAPPSSEVSAAPRLAAQPLT